MSYDGTLKFDTSIDTKEFQQSANRIGDIIKGIAGFGILQKGFQALVSHIDGAIDRYDTLSKYPEMLQQLGYSEDAAAQSAKKLSDGIQGLPTTLDSVVSTAQRITILTGNLEKATDTTLALNNAFLASNSNADNAARGLEQYVQMLSKGEVDMQSWRTLQETMGYALNETAKAFGFAGESAQNDLYSALQKGEITFGQFNTKILELNTSVGGFAELAKTATGGIKTSWTNLNTALVRGIANSTEAFDRGLSATKFKSIENVISQATKGINKAFTVVAKGAEAVAGNMDNIVIAGGAVLTTFVAFKGIKAAQTAMQGASAAISAFNTTVGAAKTTMDLWAVGAKTMSEVCAELTLKEIATGTAAMVQAGEMTVASGAANIFKAAMIKLNAVLLANPVLAVVAGVIALSAAILLVVNNMDGYYKKTKELHEANEELISSNEQLLDSLDANQKEYEKSSQSADHAADTYQKMADKVYDLQAAIQNGTVSDESMAAAKRELATRVNDLNGAVDGLNLAYDANTNKLNKNNAETKDAIKNQKELVKAAAEQKRQASIIDDIVAAEDVKWEIDRQLAEIEKQRIQMAGELTDGTYRNSVQMVDASLAAKNLMDDEQALNEQREEAIEKIDSLNARYDERAAALQANTDEVDATALAETQAMDELAAQWGVSADSIRADMAEMNISAEEWAEKQLETAQAATKAMTDYGQSVNDTADGIANNYEELPTKMDVSLQEANRIMRENTEKQIEFDNKLKQLEGLGLSADGLRRLRDEGTAASGWADELIADADKLQEFDDTVSGITRTAVDNVIANMQRVDPAIVTAFNTANINAGVKMDELGNLVSTKSGELVGKFDEATQTLQVSDGLEVAWGENVLAALDAGNAEAEGAANTGETMITQTTDAVEAGGGEVAGAMTTVVNSAIQAGNEAAAASPSIGTGIIGGIVSGVLNGAGALYNVMRSVIQNALAASKSEAEINSPSALFGRIVGFGIDEGIAKYIVKGASFITNAFGTLMDKIMPSVPQISGDYGGLLPQMQSTVLGSRMRTQAALAGNYGMQYATIGGYGGGSFNTSGLEDKIDNLNDTMKEVRDKEYATRLSGKDIVMAQNRAKADMGTEVSKGAFANDR